MKDYTSELSIHPREQSNDGSPPRLTVIFTRNLPQLREFNFAFAGSGAAAPQGEDKCVLRLAPKQYVVLVNQREDHRETERSPGVRMLHVDQDKTSTKRQRKALAVDVGSVEALLISYDRVKGHGIMPVQTSIDGATATIRFKNPDGNVVELYSDLPNSTKRSALTSEDGSCVSGRGMIETDPNILVQRLQSSKATSTVPEAELDKHITAFVKSEQIMTG